MGLNIELKSSAQYKTDFGIDVNQRLYDILKENNMETRSKSAKSIPVIIQAFDHEPLQFFKEIALSPEEAFPTTLLVNWPIREYQRNWSPSDFKTKGFADIIGPDWRYLYDKDRNPE